MRSRRREARDEPAEFVASRAASARAYTLLLYACPSRFRQRYGAEMARRLFRDCWRDAARERGPWGVLRVWPGALGDLVRTGALEWVAGLRLPATARNHVVLGPGRRHAMGERLRRLRRGVDILLHVRAYPTLRRRICATASTSSPSGRGAHWYSRRTRRAASGTATLGRSTYCWGCWMRAAGSPR